METRDILKDLQNGTITIEEAEAFFKRKPIEDLGYAKLDMHRHVRSGFPEVIYCQGKTDEHLLAVFSRLYEEYGVAMGTRATPEQANLVMAEHANAHYDKVSRILRIGEPPAEQKGLIAVCSAGTADIPVAEEAAQVAEYFGSKVDRIYDIGVAGIHRVLSNVERIQNANCVIAVAGMEGALASVVAGLVDKPVIAVPTSVGYGASFHGVAALLTMINSCANGISVVNIDNGYGAGYIATQINRMGVRHE